MHFAGIDIPSVRKLYLDASGNLLATALRQ